MPISLQSSCSVASVITVLGLTFAVGNVQAVNRQRDFVHNATGTCQSALPVFDGQIRKRPLAIQNEGTSSAFINCSLLANDRAIDGLIVIQVFADNNTASPSELTCTLVTGLSKFGTPQFLPKTITMPANSGRNEFVWGRTDNGGNNFNNFTANVSCNLPAGTGLSQMIVVFDEDAGA